MAAEARAIINWPAQRGSFGSSGRPRGSLEIVEIQGYMRSRTLAWRGHGNSGAQHPPARSSTTSPQHPPTLSSRHSAAFPPHPAPSSRNAGEIGGAWAEPAPLPALIG